MKRKEKMLVHAAVMEMNLYLKRDEVNTNVKKGLETVKERNEGREKLKVMRRKTKDGRN